MAGKKSKDVHDGKRKTPEQEEIYPVAEPAQTHGEATKQPI